MRLVAANGDPRRDTGALGSALRFALRAYDPVPEEVRQAARAVFAARQRAAPVVGRLIVHSTGSPDVAVVADGRPVRTLVFRVPGHVIRLVVADGRVRAVAGQIDPARAAEGRLQSGSSDVALLVAEDGKFAVDQLDTGPLVVALDLMPTEGTTSIGATRVVLTAPADS